jgi:hypothetical protein
MDCDPDNDNHHSDCPHHRCSSQNSHHSSSSGRPLAPETQSQPGQPAVAQAAASDDTQDLRQYAARALATRLRNQNLAHGTEEVDDEEMDCDPDSDNDHSSQNSHHSSEELSDEEIGIRSCLHLFACMSNYVQRNPKDAQPFFDVIQKAIFDADADAADDNKTPSSSSVDGNEVSSETEAWVLAQKDPEPAPVSTDVTPNPNPPSTS